MSQAITTLLAGFKARDFVTVTPSDSVNFAEGLSIGIYVGVSGDVSLVTKAGNSVTLKNVAAGIIHPIPCTRVNSTGTTATEILAVY